MRVNSFITVLFLATHCFAQDSSFIKTTNSIVKDIDKNSRIVGKFRWQMGHIEYSAIDNNTISKIFYSRKAGPRQLIEIFYLQDTALLFAQKQAYSCYFYGDSTVLLNECYFKKGSLSYYTVYYDDVRKTLTQIQEFILSEYNRVRSIISLYKKRNTTTNN